MRQNTREVILTVAMKLFAEKGYAGCSIREICEAAGVTKPVLYYHFRDKADLYRELMVKIFGQTQSNLSRLCAFQGSLRDRLILYVSSEFRNCRRDPVSQRFLFRAVFSSEAEHPYFNFIEEFQRERRMIAEFIEKEMKGTGIDEPHLASTALMGMMLIAILEFLFTGKRTLERRNAEQLVDLLLSPGSRHTNTIPMGKKRRSRA